MEKKSSSQKLFNIEDEKISVFSTRRFACFASFEKIFCTIYGIEISPSPLIFGPVQLTLQTRIRLKYLSILCFNMLLSMIEL